MIDVRQSQAYADYLKKIGWTVERIGEINYFIKKLPLIGSVLKIQRPEEIRIDTIRKLARKYRVFQTIVEPKTELDARFLTSIGFKLSKNPFLPTKTLQIDLTKSRESIFRHFEKDARQAIRKAYSPERPKGVEGGEGIKTKTYSTPDEIKKFREGWKNIVKLKRFVPPANQLINLRKSFPNNNSLFLASHNISGNIMGGVIFTRTSHGIAYYWQAFTGKEGRTSLSSYSLLFQGILWAKRHDCKIFDFEGIYDSRFPNKSWLGFTHFKRSFGGYEVEYPGCYTKLSLPV